MVISVMAPPRFFVAFVEDKGRAGGGGRTTPVQAVQACCPSHTTRAAVSRVSTRCPVGSWSLRGPTLPTDDTVSARAAYTRADRLDTGRLAHPRALRLSSGPRPFLGYRVGGHAPAAR